MPWDRTHQNCQDFDAHLLHYTCDIAVVLSSYLVVPVAHARRIVEHVAGVAAATNEAATKVGVVGQVAAFIACATVHSGRVNVGTVEVKVKSLASQRRHRRERSGMMGGWIVVANLGGEAHMQQLSLGE
jgi:hypothetical protein